MKKILIIGGAIYGNRGAEAMTVTTIARIREKFPDAQFGIMTPYPKQDRKLIDPGVNCVILDSSPLYLAGILFPFAVLSAPFKRTGLMKKMPEALRFLAECDLVVDIAGVSFIDGREKFLPYNILTILIPFMFGVPVFKLAQAMGPFRNPLNKLCAKLFLTRCKRIFARGQKTYSHFTQLKTLPGVLHRASDIVFLNEFGDSLTDENTDRLEKTLDSLDKVESRIIGFCPSAVIYKNSMKENWDYIDFNVRLIELFKKMGFHVLLFPNATRAKNPDSLMNNDIPVIDKIMRKVATENLTVVNYDLNCDGIKKLIQKTHLCLVSRFHAMIFSLILKIPVIVIGWSHKYKEVLNQYGFDEYVFDYKNLDPDTIREAIEKMDANYEETLNLLARKLPEIQAEAKVQFDYIDQILDKM